MKTKLLISSLTLKTVHVVVVLSILLTSVFSVASVKRAAAQAPEAISNELTLSGLFRQIIPTYHRQQALRDRIYRILNIDPNQPAFQEDGTAPSDGGRTQPTPTPSSNLPPTPTETQAPPTDIITPTTTLAPTETVEPTLTVPPCEGRDCVTPTPLPEDTETPAATPTITETVPVTGEIDGRIAITLTLTATPTLAAPGDVITLTWASKRDKPLDGLELRLALPEGIDLWGVPDGSYDPVTRQLVMPIVLASGSLGFVILPDATGPFVFKAELWWNGELRVQRSLSLPLRGPFKLDPKGGKARGLNRRVQVNFPDGALPEAVHVEGKPPAAEGTPLSLGGDPFEITAFSQATGEEVNQFTRPITIEVSYDASRYGNEESSLKLFYYNETERDWYPLETVVDTQRHTLMAWSDHLTIFDFQAQNWEAARLPSLDAFQVSSFTGAASYSMNLQVPPGPAGLQPSLSLSYNSQTVDGASSRTQASWVGMAWNLGENMISRNQNGTVDYYGTEYGNMAVRDDDYSDTYCNPGSSNNWCGSDGDDTFSLSVNGQSWTLIRVPDNDGNQNTIEYRTTTESYWRVIRYHSHGTFGTYPGDTSYWYVWDKTGTRFKFESTGVYPAYPNGCSSIFLQTWQYSLTKTRNVFGQELSYTYTPETSPSPKYAPGCSGYAATTVLAVYPAEIIYPNDRYKVTFVLSDTLRTDYQSSWNNADSNVLYKRRMLKSVEVWHNPTGSWTSGDEQLIRKYVLGYADHPQDMIFPTVVWPAGGRTPTLLSITEYGYGGTNALPVTTFTYGDDMHLTVGSNGYGGQSLFTYESTPWYEIDGKGSECSSSGNVSGNVYMDTKSVCTALTTDWNWFRPKAVYKVSVEVKNNGGSTAQLGMDDGVSTQYGQTVTLSPNWQLLESYFTLSGSALRSRSKLNCPGGGCYFQNYKVIEVNTRYRVTGRTAYDPDAEHGASITNAYHYDEPATNDAAHSAFIVNVAENQRTSPVASEYRGNAMVKVTDPGGKVSTTFFYQDDNRNGSTSASLVGTESFSQAFESTNWNDYSGTWGYNGAQPTFERVTGDGAAKVTNASADWTRALYRSAYTVSGGEAVIVQFRLSSTSQQTILALNSADGGYYRWGLKQDDTDFKVQKCTSSSGCDDSATSQVLLSNVQAGRWYVLVLIVDSANDNRFLAWVWDRDDPSTTQIGRYEEDLSTYGGKTWRFMMKAQSGTAWLDEYSEGQLYSMSSSFYATQTFTTADEQLPTKENGVVYRDVQRTWMYATQSRSFSFEGDATWNGTRTTNDYNTADQGSAQYGNLTRVLEASWDAANGHWDDYRLTRTIFHPYTGTTGNPLNLVGLTGMVMTYSCLSTDTNGACMTGFADSRLTGSQWMLYDGHTTDIAPSEGKPTGARTLLRCNGTCSSSTEYFSDSAFAYDTYGNRTTTTVYTSEGTYSNYGQGTARSSYTCYGGGGTLNGNACTDDGYHTYVLWERNTAPTPHLTQITYSGAAVYGTTVTGYTLSVPVSLVDPNNVTTSAEYDVFGRMTAIIRNGDDHTNPTARMSYYDTASPFYTEAQQRISGTTYFKIRKYYNGLGQKLQTQVVGAVVNGATKDILVDTWYNASGQVEKQTVPYAVNGGSYYQSRNAAYAYNAHTTYDALGRTVEAYATDNTYTTYVYKDLETEVTDARDKTTHTLTDVWGRTTMVIPHVGVTVEYTSYDTQGRLKQVVYGYDYNVPEDITTNLTYDIAGRKLSMDDPDLGYWSYTYNAMSNLSTQTDARGCTITMSYDSLNRLTGKSFSGCASSSPSSYAYDSTASGNKGIGRRTSMSNTSNGKSVSVSWKYDERGRTLSETRTVASETFLTQWTYNAADLPVTMVYPGDNNNGAGETVNFTYHPQMLLNTSTGSYTYVKGVDYDAAGRMDLLSLGLNGSNLRVKIDYTYYGWNSQGGRLQYLKAGTPSNATSLQNLTYTYDEGGNVLTILDANNSNQKQCFGYDDLNRLTSAKVGQNDANCSGAVGNGEYADETYDYDINTGNLSSKTGNGSYAYDDAAHKHAVTYTSGSGYTYSYDNNGNMTGRNVGTAYTYNYDAENRLSSVVVGGSTIASFVYDADGVRIRGTSNSVTTDYVGNYFEWNSTTSTMTKYYYAGGTRVAMRTGTNTPLWLMGDHLGSTSQTANYDGTAYSGGYQLYKPWGEKRYPTGASTLPTTYRYTGQRQDSYINLYWYGSRWYDDSLGRFTQPDSIVPEASQGTQAWDRFGYVNNNPVTYNDPTGHSCNSPDPSAQKYCEQGQINAALDALEDNAVGASYAEYIKDNGIEVTFGSCGGANGCTDDSKIYINPEFANESPEILARWISHETFHTMVPGNSLYEEYQGFKLMTDVSLEFNKMHGNNVGFDSNSGGMWPKYDFSKTNPLDPNELKKWFSDNGLYGTYQTLPTYSPQVTVLSQQIAPSSR